MLIRRSTKRISRQDIYVRPLLPALLVFLALMVIIGVSWKTARQDIKTQLDNNVNQNAFFVESTMQQRFSIYEDTLRAANGLFIGSDIVTRDEWRGFVESLKLGSRYPGIRGVGYIKLIPEPERISFVTSVQAEGITDFHIYPEDQRNIYAVTTYVVPTAGQTTDDHSALALGFDMYTDPIRKAAMDRAANTGEPALSGALDLIPNGNGQLRGFLLFMPLYKKSMPVATAAERTAALDGFFFAPFETTGIFTSLFKLKDSSFAFSIYDGSISASNHLYDSNNDINSPIYTESKHDKLMFYGHEWIFAYKTKRDIVPYSVRSRPWTALFGGGIFAAALALIIYLLIQRRTRALSYQEQKRLEEAKDELLSLASHQLRTPATAVKQYILMVKDGFAGKITIGQRKLLQMAHESNERQLTIVDDLLYVARIDAGQAKINAENFSVSQMLKSVVEEMLPVIKDRKQDVVFKQPNTNIFAEADPNYVRMIFENLLSNASKYSLKNTKIIVDLKNFNDFIKINFIDQGVGIEPEYFADVFRKFSRIPNELTRQISGSGIGLYLARQLALLHAGDITFTSSPGKGSTFTVMLPKKRPKELL